MPTHVRLLHETLLDGRFHVYTSPDVKGLHAPDDTKAGAQRQAIAILDLFARDEGATLPTVEFVEPALPAAAE